MVRSRRRTPTRPKRARPKYLAVGVAASFALSFGVGMILEIRDPVLVTLDQLESAGESPVLGSVPRIS